MSPTAKELLLKCLEDVADNPARFRRVIPMGHEQAYFAGFGFALRFGLPLFDDREREREGRAAAAEARGFNANRPPAEQMIERGLSPQEVLAELARLEIAFIQLVATDAT